MASVRRSELTDACKLLQRLVAEKPGTIHSCCSSDEFYDLTEEPAWVLYANRWKSILDYSKKRLHIRPSKQNYHQMLESCDALTKYCEKGVRQIQSQSYPAIGVITVQLIDWILLARVVAILVHDFLTAAQWEIIRKMGSHAEGKIVDYLNWIKLYYPHCPNASPGSACLLIRSRTFAYIDFICKNCHCDWNGFHTFIEQMEYERLNNGEIAQWCATKGFYLPIDG